MHAVRIVLYMLIRAEDAVEMHETTLMGCETEGFCKLRPDGACDPPACGGFDPLTDPNPTLGGGQVRPDHPAGISLLKHSTDPTNQAMPQQARTLAHHHLQADRIVTCGCRTCTYCVQSGTEINNSHETSRFSAPELDGPGVHGAVENVARCHLVSLTEGTSESNLGRQWRNQQAGCGLTPRSTHVDKIASRGHRVAVMAVLVSRICCSRAAAAWR
jgi:hypothetical protein